MHSLLASGRRADHRLDRVEQLVHPGYRLVGHRRPLKILPLRCVRVYDPGLSRDLLTKEFEEQRSVLALTVYNPCFDGHGMDATYQQGAESAVSILDDVIQLEARRRSFDILELRTLFDDHAGYANPIEAVTATTAKDVLVKLWTIRTNADIGTRTSPAQ